MGARPSWQKQRKPGHRMPRHAKRRRVDIDRHQRRRVACWLWSANGDLVTSFDTSGADIPPFCIVGGIRYDRVDNVLRPKVAHYQTGTIMLRCVASCTASA